MNATATVPTEMIGTMETERAFCNETGCPWGSDDDSLDSYRELKGLPALAPNLYVTLVKAREVALRLTREEVIALWDERLAITSKEGQLNAAERVRVGEIHTMTDGHPASCNLHILLLVVDERTKGYPVAEWLPEFVQEELWTVLWWQANGPTWKLDGAPWVMEALAASPPVPEGWLPETRRHLFT